MAQLHRHSSRWNAPELLDGLEQDETWLDDHLGTLRRAVSAGILSEAEWSAVEAACDRVRDVMHSLGREPLHWGPVHGDLHQDNLLFDGDEVRPIDFGELRIAHFPHDLGVTLYHLMYVDDINVRRVLFEGYESVRPLAPLPDLAPESFLCAVALSNLSFQVTVPSQRNSSLFKRNVRAFATVYCKNLVAGETFALS